MELTLGMKLKAARKSQGLDQNAVADYLGTTRQAISQYERGANSPSRKNLEKLAELYNVDIDYLKYENQTLGALIEYKLQEKYGMGELSDWEKNYISEQILKIYDLVK